MWRLTTQQKCRDCAKINFVKYRSQLLLNYVLPDPLDGIGLSTIHKVIKFQALL